MSERKPTRKPTVMIGSTVASGGGSVNTGQLLYSLGGARTATVYSGTAGGDANVAVGGGRVDKVNLHQSTLLALSGQAVVLYDAAVAVSGGPIAASGHKVVASLSPPLVSLISGQTSPGVIMDVGFTFSSGLCYASRSGMGGFSVSYTPTVSGVENAG